MAMAEEQPERAIIVIGNPGLPRGPLQTACQNCSRKYPATAATSLLIFKAKREDKEAMIICFGCFQAARREGYFRNTEAMGTTAGLKRLSAP